MVMKMFKTDLDCLRT